MDTTKKILIIHASAGHGHEKAALAVAEALSGMGAEPWVRDSLDHVWKPFGIFYKNSYLWMIRHAPALWGASYHAMDIRALSIFLRPLRRLVNGLMAQGVRRLFLARRPDAIVCTHFMAVEIAGAMKSHGEFSGKLIAVITDYLAHAFWVDPRVDLYAVGCEKTVEDLVRRGVPRDKIRMTGLPTMRAFRLPQHAEEFRAQLGLLAGPRTVLLTSGGAGVGPLEEVARDLARGEDGFQILAVCGTNGKLEERLAETALANPALRVFGFVNNMHELMSVSDLLVGKAGGLTLSESFCLGLPIVMMRPVPGQEERNASVTVAADAGVRTGEASEALRQVRSILKDPERLSRMKHAAQMLGRPDAAEAIARLALS